MEGLLSLSKKLLVRANCRIKHSDERGRLYAGRRDIYLKRTKNCGPSLRATVMTFSGGKIAELLESRRTFLSCMICHPQPLCCHRLRHRGSALFRMDPEGLPLFHRQNPSRNKCGSPQLHVTARFVLATILNACYFETLPRVMPDSTW